MRPHISLLLSALAATLLCGCSHISVVPAPAAADVAHLGVQGEVPAFLDTQVMAGDLPMSVLVATIRCSSPTASFQSIGRKAAEAASELGADHVYFGSMNAVTTGATTQQIGSTFITTNNQAFVATAFALRSLGLTTGIAFDANRMVIKLSDEARECGIQEGDTLLTIDGQECTTGRPSPHRRALLARKPGDRVRVIWIRPGDGRMEGELELQPQEPSFEGLARLDTDPPRQERPKHSARF